MMLKVCLKGDSVVVTRLQGEESPSSFATIILGNIQLWTFDFSSFYEFLVESCFCEGNSRTNFLANESVSEVVGRYSETSFLMQLWDLVHVDEEDYLLTC